MKTADIKISNIPENLAPVIKKNIENIFEMFNVSGIDVSVVYKVM